MTQNAKASGMRDSRQFRAVGRAMPMPTMAGGTAAVKNATAQIARLRMRWPVPEGGAEYAPPRTGRRPHVSP